MQLAHGQFSLLLILSVTLFLPKFGIAAKNLDLSSLEKTQINLNERLSDNAREACLIVLRMKKF